MATEISLERVVEAQPESLAGVIHRIDRTLERGDRRERVDAARAYRAAAEGDPSTVEPFCDRLTALLDHDDGAVRLNGAIALAELAESAPEAVDPAVPALVALLESDGTPATNVAAVRALTRVGERDPGAVGVADGPVASRVREGSGQSRSAVLGLFGAVVIEAPSSFPEAVLAAEAALGDGSVQVRRVAATTLARVARVEPTAVTSFDRLRSAVERLHAEVNGDHISRYDDVARAVETVRELDDG